MSRQRNTKLDGLQLRANLLTYTAPVTKTTAGAVTYTASEFTSGIILRDPNGAGRTDITPSASALYTELGDPEIGSTFQVIIRNTADAAETITMQGHASVTISGTATIAQNNTKIFIGRFTSASAVTLYSIGTLVH